MLKKVIDKRNYIIFFIIIVLIIWVIWSIFFHKNKAYIETFNYFGEEITFKIYEKVNHKKITDDINNIYKKYDKMDFKGKLSKDEKALIEYGKILYYKTGGYIDVTSGKLISNLKEGKDYSFKSEIDKLEIKDDKLVNKIDFNLDGIISSYATNDVLYYFKQNKIKKYIVSENGDISAGEYYKKGKYKVGINKPNSEEILKIVSLENKSMASRYTTNEFESYMVNPKSSKKESKYDGVIVIADDNLTASMLASSLYLMDIDEGEKLVKDYHSEALWIKDDEIKMTDGFKNYIKNN